MVSLSQESESIERRICTIKPVQSVKNHAANEMDCEAQEMKDAEKGTFLEEESIGIDEEDYLVQGVVEDSKEAVIEGASKENVKISKVDYKSSKKLRWILPKSDLKVETEKDINVMKSCKRVDPLDTRANNVEVKNFQFFSSNGQTE